MAAPKKENPEEDKEDWLVTYADAITLLMAFFVMLLTFAEFDIPAYEELTSALASNIGKRDNVQTTTQSLKIDAQDIIYNMQADQVATVGSDEKGVTIELQSNAFFKPGSAEIVPAAIPVLKELAATLASTQYELYNVVVEGHTDDGTINTPQFPSNWELSAGRASSVVRLFESNEVDRARLKATGYADTRPKVPNRDLQGQPIPENRATNRRVVLRLHPMSLEERDAYLTAQEIKREQAAARARAEGGGPGIEDRLPILPTPAGLPLEQLETKQALNELKQQLRQRIGTGGPLEADDLKIYEDRFQALLGQRSGALEEDFSQIETFLSEERARLSTAPAN